MLCSVYLVHPGVNKAVVNIARMSRGSRPYLLPWYLRPTVLESLCKKVDAFASSFLAAPRKEKNTDVPVISVFLSVRGEVCLSV